MCSIIVITTFFFRENHEIHFTNHEIKISDKNGPKAFSYGTFLRTENERFFRAAKPNAQNSIDNLIMIRVFQIFFGQQVVTNTGTQQREDGSTMRYAKALPRNFRFLPGLHGARRTGASQPMQKQHGTREEANTTHTLHARRVVFGCHLFLSLAVSISFINS